MLPYFLGLAALAARARFHTPGFVPLGVVVLLVTAPYWLGPVMVRLTNRQRCTYRYEQLSPGRPLPPAVASFMNASAAALARAGFTPTAPFFQTDGSGKSSGFLQLFEHPRHGDVATVMCALQSQEPGADPVALVGFTAEFEDGSRQATGNSPLPSATPPRRGEEATRFPGERDAERLYRLHRALAQRRGRRQRLTNVGDPVAFQRAQDQRSQERMVSSGWYFHEGDVLRPTWRGAFLAASRHLWPWRQQREAGEERLRRQLLGELGVARG
jgi:hypothetical protein